MKYVFVINSYTNLKNKDKILKKIDMACKELKYDYVIEDNSQRETEDILKKYKHSKNIILAIGGDGMINRVLNGIIGTDNVLGFIPLGTGNDLYKNILENKLEKITTCDTIKINEKYFINVACFGMDADIANNKDEVKLPKNLKYIGGIFKSIFKYHNREFKVSINDEKIENKFATIAVCNGSFYGNGFKIGAKSYINDSKMEVYLIEDISKLKMISLILKMKNGKHENSQYVKKIVTDRILISSKIPVKCNIDGEILTANNFDITMKCKSIKLYYDEELIRKIIN